MTRDWTGAYTHTIYEWCDARAGPGNDGWTFTRTTVSLEVGLHVQQQVVLVLGLFVAYGTLELRIDAALESDVPAEAVESRVRVAAPGARVHRALVVDGGQVVLDSGGRMQGASAVRVRRVTWRRTAGRQKTTTEKQTKTLYKLSAPGPRSLWIRLVV